mgnify:CR=1 FL=1
MLSVDVKLFDQRGEMSNVYTFPEPAPTKENFLELLDVLKVITLIGNFDIEDGKGRSLQVAR